MVQAFFFLTLDAAPVLLCTTLAGCFCLWSPQAWVHMDAGLDHLSCRSYDPGNATRGQTVNKENYYEYIV